MALALADVAVFGPAFPEPFVRLQLEAALAKRDLLPKATGDEGRALQDSWEILRRKLRELRDQGGELRVANHVLEPLAPRLGYQAQLARAEDIETREGAESGGYVLVSADGSARLRVWAVPVDTDLDAPARRGRAYRFSPARVAQRVLRAQSERVGLLTNGQELRLLLADPALPDGHLEVRLDGASGWRAARNVPDSFRLLVALGSPRGVAAVPELLEEARLAQTGVTKKLREQARAAVEGFVQELLDHPQNAAALAARTDRAELARALWREGLTLVYRLLFILKLEASADPARAFHFVGSRLWKDTYSPRLALGRVARLVLDEGGETGEWLERGLRALFGLFAEGLDARELRIHALGGMLFGRDAMPVLDGLRWGERAVAKLLDQLLWTEGANGARERVHYGALDVEDLGRVYEALLELEPGIAGEPMARLRRQKLEVVVPAAQAEAYRTQQQADPEEEQDEDEDQEEEEAQDETPKKKRGKGKAAPASKVRFIEDIAPGKFFLRVGLGRKSSGSYYTPHAFVRFLVQETLGPQIAERSPAEDPQPSAIVGLRVVDPAMGSGHFLVEACRYLGDALYEACRLCDERASEAEAEAENAEQAGKKSEAARQRERAAALRGRVAALPDPTDELLAYLPSRVPEGQASGLSQRKAEALCRRLVAVHCLYGVDKNPMAIELAKLALWLESYAEGLPLTFMDHRLVLGDSLTGPFFDQVLTFPRSGNRIEPLFAEELEHRLAARLDEALAYVRDLEASVGMDVADLEKKRAAKIQLDAALAPFRLLAAAWSGGVQLGDGADDPAYERLLKAVASGDDAEALVRSSAALTRMTEVGRAGLPWDLVFPEVFHPSGEAARIGGFDAVLGNPPWDAIQFKSKEFLAAFNLNVLDAPTKREREEVEQRLLGDRATRSHYDAKVEEFERIKRLNDRLFSYQKVTIDGDLAGRQLDAFRVFCERSAFLLGPAGFVGLVLPSAFHANAGGTGVRRLFLESLSLRCCFSFENRRALFDIHRSFKFATVVARASATSTDAFDCAFYLHDAEWLFQRRDALRYSLDFVRRTGGDYLTLVEARSPEHLRVLSALYSQRRTFRDFLDEHGVTPNTSELPMIGGGFFTSTADLNAGDARDPESAQALLARGYIAMHEGKTFHQFDDRWEEPPRYAVHVGRLLERPRWRELCRFYRLVYREVSASTNERTGIFTLLAPPHVTARNAASDITPNKHPYWPSLLLAAIGNSFPFDYALRASGQMHVTLFMVSQIPVPRVQAAIPMLVRSALRLIANHAGYAPLWREQLGDAWCELKPKHTWPVIAGDDARWRMRAAMDAVVAHGYGLSREHYEHVLASFNHENYPAAPTLCLGAFDELHTLGLEAFVRARDPYCDVPLVETLPQPVIALPLPTDPDVPPPGVERSGQGQLFAPDPGPLFAKAKRKKKP